MSQSIGRWDKIVADDLERLRGLQLFRQRKAVRPLDATHVEVGGRVLINFSSNNYLGLTHHPRVIAAANAATAEYGFGSAAAPLITGYGIAHESAERAIAQWKGTEAAVLLPSGYQANLAAIQTVAAMGRLTGGVRFLVDKLAHASLIDAIRGSGEPFRIFPHNHVGKLRRLLEQAPPGELQVVVTESIFSMDGDAADLPAIAQLKQSHDFFLVLDEAHATGVYGPGGAGLAAELGLRHAVDVSILTLSKALGGIGGVVCASAVFCDALINYGRAYLFSTGVPPAVASAGEAAIGVLIDEPWRQERVRQLARYVREELAKMGGNSNTWKIPQGDSPIVPLILGEESAALNAADASVDGGLLIMPVRPPTVSRGSSRLRITMSCEHSDLEVDKLLTVIKKLWR